MQTLEVNGNTSFNGITILDSSQPTYEVQFKMKNLSGEWEEGIVRVMADNEETCRKNFTSYLESFKGGTRIQLWVAKTKCLSFYI